MPWLLLLPVLLPARPAMAHGAAHGPHPAWSFDPWVVTPLLICLLAYCAGTAVLWRRRGPGRGIGTGQVIAYLAGWLALAAALVSPLHWLGEQLFTAHMIEHEVIMAIAAPLLVLGRPVAAALWALPTPLRRALGGGARQPACRSAWRLLTRPATATLLHGIVIWVWHIPVLFDATLTDAGLHRAQHLSFLVTALLFWWALLQRSHPAMAAAHLFVTMIHTGLLGALLTFAPQVLYAAQTAEAGHWGLSPLEDQQLAGLVMWVPAGLVYGGAALAFFGRWLSRAGRPYALNAAAALPGRDDA